MMGSLVAVETKPNASQAAVVSEAKCLRRTLWTEYETELITEVEVQVHL